jgi:hypothetical protein
MLASLHHILLTGTADIGDETASGQSVPPLCLPSPPSPFPPLSTIFPPRLPTPLHLRLALDISHSQAPRPGKSQFHLRRAGTCMGPAPFPSACRRVVRMGMQPERADRAPKRG